MRTITPERVTAQNEINAVANEIEGHLVRLLSDWQQKKAVKVSGYGGFVQKLKAQLEQYNASHGYNVQDGDWWLNVHTSYTSVVASVRNRRTQQSVEIYLARFDKGTGVLLSLLDCVKRQTDYTAESVNAAFAEASRLENQARELLSSVSDFRR